jgi:hypothetical protein
MTAQFSFPPHSMQYAAKYFTAPISVNLLRTTTSGYPEELCHVVSPLNTHTGPCYTYPSQPPNNEQLWIQAPCQHRCRRCSAVSPYTLLAISSICSCWFAIGTDGRHVGNPSAMAAQQPTCVVRIVKYLTITRYQLFLQNVALYMLK